MTDQGLILCSQIQTVRNDTKWQENSEFLIALDRWVRAVEQELEELQRKLRRVKHKRA
jgi:hypothetical protein